MSDYDGEEIGKLVKTKQGIERERSAASPGSPALQPLLAREPLESAFDSIAACLLAFDEFFIFFLFLSLLALACLQTLYFQQLFIDKIKFSGQSEHVYSLYFQNANWTLYLRFLHVMIVFWKKIEVMSGSRHLDRASNDKFTVQCLVWFFQLTWKLDLKVVQITKNGLFLVNVSL